MYEHSNNMGGLTLVFRPYNAEEGSEAVAGGRGRASVTITVLPWVRFPATASVFSYAKKFIRK